MRSISSTEHYSIKLYNTTTDGVAFSVELQLESMEVYEDYINSKNRVSLFTQ